MVSVQPLSKNLSKDGSKHYIGEFYAGGIVFYVDPSGEHGLVVSPTDVKGNEAMVSWCDSKPYKIDKWANNNYDGMFNTNLIIKSGIKSAAELCVKYGKDWYLPSIEELQKLEANLQIINDVLEKDNNNSTQPINFSAPNEYNISYWSSTKYNDIAAWAVIFSNDTKSALTRSTSDKCYIRAIKAF